MFWVLYSRKASRAYSLLAKASAVAEISGIEYYQINFASMNLIFSRYSKLFQNSILINRQEWKAKKILDGYWYHKYSYQMKKLQPKREFLEIYL